MKRILPLLFCILICFSCNKENPLIDPGNYAQYVVVDSEGSWTTKGSRIVFKRKAATFEESGLHIIEVNTLVQSQIYEGLAESPDWSPDSSKIVFVSNASLMLINSNGDSLRSLNLLGSGFYKYSSWKWSNKILFSYKANGNEKYSLFLTDDVLTSAQRIDENAVFGAWDMTGESIFYFKPFNTGTIKGDSLMKFNTIANRKDFIKIFSSPDNAINDFLSVKNSIIYFSSQDTAGIAFIYKINSDGSGFQKIGVEQSWAPEISLTGSELLYTNRNLGNGLLWLMNTDGSNRRQITN